MTKQLFRLFDYLYPTHLTVRYLIELAIKYHDKRKSCIDIMVHHGKDYKKARLKANLYGKVADSLRKLSHFVDWHSR